MLNTYNGAVTFILQMNVREGAGDILSWITGRSVLVTSEFNEEKTKRFEWFLTPDQSKATLIEVFDDNDGALVRVENLMSSPIAPEWTDRFEIESLTVLVWHQISGSMPAVLPSPKEDWGRKKPAGCGRIIAL
jgi:hypothetical protein